MNEKMEDRQVSILFSDISGFSKLEPQQLANFVNAVMGEIASLLQGRNALVTNTWGDAVFLVFSTAAEAADCALRLRDVVKNTDWRRRNVFADLRMRIALHNAHVTIIEDPITRRPNAFGEHVTQAARLEPVGIPNEILVTDNFKTALDATRDRRFVLETIGPIMLAKDWGLTNVHRLRWQGEQPLEHSVIDSLLKKKSDESTMSLMPHADSLLKNQRTAADVQKVLDHIDKNMFGKGVIQRNWLIRAKYDTSRIAQEGIVVENLYWSFELINLTDSIVDYPFTLLGVSELELNPREIKVFRVEEDGTQTKILSEDEELKRNGLMGTREREITLPPFCRYKLDLQYSQGWPVNPQKPVVHNTFYPRRISFGNRLEIDAPEADALSVSVGGAVLKSNDFGNEHRYDIPSPLLQHQAIEFLLRFRVSSV